MKSIIIGKGVAGEQLHKILLDKGDTVIGFLDDNAQDVLGGISDLENILKRDEGVINVYFAIPSLENKNVLKKIRSICHSFEKKLYIIPSIVDIIGSNVSIDLVREVSIEDLLFRPIKKYNVDKIREFIHGKTILITGTAGTIGSELLNQCVKYGAKNIIGIDHSEIGIFNISQGYQNNKNVFFYIKSLKDKTGLKSIFKKHEIDLVFNAAAYKHVYQMELNPDEAVSNNIFGLKNIIEVSNECGVKDFCQISTDKAVNPTNIMGASKRVGELMLHYYNELFPDMNMVAVRFGNVLGSSGSVLEVFKKQVKEGKPLTVTDENITRYFMSIEEAVNLVITSTTLNKNGVIFVLDMGEPIKVIDLARKYLEVSNAVGIGIVITGLKPGEKLYEELILDKTHDKGTEIDEIFITEDKGDYKNILSQIEGLKGLYNRDEISSGLLNILPEFKHNK